MYKNSGEIDIDIDVIHRLVKCMYARVGKMKSCILLYFIVTHIVTRILLLL